jgi:hypothetical protein
MLKKYITAISVTAALVMVSVVPSAADHEYGENYGGWRYDQNAYEQLVLGFGDGWGMAYAGTASYCEYQGVGYETMRRTLRESTYSGRWVYWWVEYTCRNGYERICIDNGNNVRCSTYVLIGEVRLNE